MSAKSDEFWIRLCTEWVLAVDEMKKDWKKNWFRNICGIAWWVYWICLLYAGNEIFLQASEVDDFKGMLAGMMAFLIALQMIIFSFGYRLLSDKIKYLKDKA